MNAELNLEGYYYNDALSAWEPLIEPIIKNVSLLPSFVLISPSIIAFKVIKVIPFPDTEADKEKGAPGKEPGSRSVFSLVLQKQTK